MPGGPAQTYFDDSPRPSRPSPAMPHDHHDHPPHALLPPDPALRVRALETLMVRKGLIDPAALDAILDTYENRIGPQIGLRRDTSATLAALGMLGRQGEHIHVVENTPETHNVVV